MPQLNPEFFVSQLFWLAVFFTFLFVFLWRVSLPRIATVLEKRQNKIDENLSSAKELQEQALEIEKKINDQINKAKLETDEKIKETIDVQKPVIFDCVVDKAENCFPMIPSGKPHNQMILGPEEEEEEITDEGKILV